MVFAARLQRRLRAEAEIDLGLEWMRRSELRRRVDGVPPDRDPRRGPAGRMANDAQPRRNVRAERLQSRPFGPSSQPGWIHVLLPLGGRSDCTRGGSERLSPSPARLAWRASTQ